MSTRYAIATAVKDGGVYADGPPGTEHDRQGCVLLEGRILDGITASLLVTAYENLSPENQDRFDSVNLTRLVALCYRLATSA